MQSISPERTAQIYCITKRLLAHQDPEVRAAVVRRNKIGYTALEFAAHKNNANVTRFLAEVCR